MGRRPVAAWAMRDSTPQGEPTGHRPTHASPRTPRDRHRTGQRRQPTRPDPCGPARRRIPNLSSTASYGLATGAHPLHEDDDWRDLGKTPRDLRILGRCGLRTRPSRTRGRFGESMFKGVLFCARYDSRSSSPQERKGSGPLRDLRASARGGVQPRATTRFVGPSYFIRWEFRSSSNQYQTFQRKSPLPGAVQRVQCAVAAAR